MGAKDEAGVVLTMSDRSTAAPVDGSMIWSALRGALVGTGKTGRAEGAEEEGTVEEEEDEEEEEEVVVAGVKTKSERGGCMREASAA